MKLIINSICILFLLTFFNGNAQTLTGKVVSITDGDTFKLLTQDSILHRIRIANIDCPEKKQPFGNKAKQFTAKAIFGKEIHVEVLNMDRYGRLIGVVTYSEELILNQELIRYGLAWHYVQYSDDSRLQELEDEAKGNKVGLWQDINAIPPWKWRSNSQSINTTKKPKAKQCSGKTNAGARCKRRTKNANGRCYQH